MAVLNAGFIILFYLHQLEKPTNYAIHQYSLGQGLSGTGTLLQGTAPMLWGLDPGSSAYIEFQPLKVSINILVIEVKI